MNETLGPVQQAITYEPVIPPGTRNQVLTPEEPHISFPSSPERPRPASSEIKLYGDVFEDVLPTSYMPICNNTSASVFRERFVPKDILVSDDAVATSAVPDDGELYEASNEALDAANLPLTGSTEDLYESPSAVAVASSAVPDDEDLCLDILNIDLAV